jgi:mycothiol synthase
MIPQLIDTKTAPDALLFKNHEFWNARRAEILPEDPPIPWEERLKMYREPAEHSVSRVVASYDGDTVLGIAYANWRDDDTENPETAWVGVVVSPEYYRKGTGSRLLHVLLEEIQPLGRQKLFASTTNVRPGGQPFAEMLDAKLGLEEHTNQLLLLDLNHEYLKRSLENAPKERFELIWFDCEYPDDDDVLQKLCDLFDVMNTAPRGDLEFNDWKSTPEKLRQEEKNDKKREHQWWLCVAREKATGHFAGFTETGWHHNRPKAVDQYGTGVNPTYQGHGLGAWLKAAMIERILSDRPSVDRIRTGNADSNAPMLKINHSLGFKPFMDQIEWQIDVAKTLAILRNRVLTSV